MTKRYSWWKEQCPAQASISWVPFNIEKLLLDIKEELFPSLAVTPTIQFASYLKYASINISNPDKPFILISDIFSHPETPISVMKYIITHELIHLVERPREIDGKLVSHPPEFRELEAKLCPDNDLSWVWMYENFFFATKFDFKNESTSFKKSRYKDLRWRERTSYSDIATNGQFFSEPMDNIKQKLEKLCLIT